MNKYTPGPWRAEHASIWADNNLIAECTLPGGSAQEALANARLMAVAPELLEALEELLMDDLCECSYCQRGRAAIAKAKGESDA